MPNLCYACRKGDHTSPEFDAPQWKQVSTTCQCSKRTCACYGFQVRAGLRTDKTQGK